jgi:transposase
MQIKFLAKQGVAKVRIAAMCGVSRQTVYNHLNRREAFPKPRAGRGSKLDAYKDYIRARLERFDLPATVLYAELMARGYAGGLSILRAYMRPLKQEFVRRLTERFETLPGQQAQVDWGECGMVTVEGGRRRKLYVFVMVLGYSRMMYAHFTTSTKLPVLLACLARAFRVLGVPAEILVDNMKQAVDQHDVTTGTVRWNATFLDFVEHYGVLPVASPPYWPRVKGKVERGVGYVKRSFLEGRSFTDLSDLNQQLEHWLATVANVRVHGTTGAQPVDRHREELHHLRRSSAVPAYDVRPVEIRRVAPDCHFSYGGVRYSVPPEACGHTVVVRSAGERVGDLLTVHLGETQLCEHTVHAKSAGRVTLAEHAEAIRRANRARVGGRPGRSRQPVFEQAPESLDLLLRGIQLLAPSVSVGSLDAYERIAQQGAA